jgi:hypothetical protein
MLASSPLPGFVGDIAGALVTCLPYAALGAFALAGLHLRGEGHNFEVGGGVVKWFFWGAILLTLPAIFSQTLPGLYGSQYAAPALPAAGTSNGAFGTTFAPLTAGVNSFVQNILLARIVPLVAAIFCFTAVLQSSEGHSPVPSIVSAIFLLGTQGFYNLAKGYTTASANSTVTFAAGDILDGMFNYLALTISPYIAVLCFVGAAVKFQGAKPWGSLALTGVAFLSMAGLWALVVSFMGGGSIAW